MQRSLCALAIVLASVLTLQGLADDKPETKPKADTKEKLVVAGERTGKLAKAPGADRTMTVSVPVGKNWTNLELPVHDDVQVRLAQPPAQFDDKGKPKKYTKKELDELRGSDKKLPGYTASLEDLKPGQMVKVMLVRKAGTPKVSKKDDIPPEYKPQVNLIVIMREAPQK